jgi:hypothetical protein
MQYHSHETFKLNPFIAHSLTQARASSIITLVWKNCLLWLRFCTGWHIVQLGTEGGGGVSSCSAGGDEDGGACRGADASSGDGNGGYEGGIAEGNVLAIAWGTRGCR